VEALQSPGEALQSPGEGLETAALRGGAQSRLDPHPDQDLALGEPLAQVQAQMPAPSLVEEQILLLRRLQNLLPRPPCSTG